MIFQEVTSTGTVERTAIARAMRLSTLKTLEAALDADI